MSLFTHTTMAKRVIISEQGNGVKLSVGKELIVLDENLSIEQAEILAVEFPQYLTIREDGKSNPTKSKIEVVETPVIVESEG